MNTQAPPLRHLVPLAVLAFGCVLLVVFGWSSFHGPLPLQPHGYRVDVPLEDAVNMEPGAEVTMAGVHIGQVVKLRQKAFQPFATIELEREFAPLRSGAVAIPRTKSLLGEAYIEIAPGPPDAAFIAEGGSLRKPNVRRAQALNDVLGAFSPAARRNFHRLSAGLASALRGRAVDLNDMLGNAPVFTGSLADVMSKLDRQRTDLARLVSASADVFSAVGRREGALQAAVQAGEGVLSTTANHDRALSAFVRTMPVFLRSVTEASGEISGTSADLNSAVRALRPLAPKVGPVVEGLRGTAPPVARAFRSLTPLLLIGTKSLPAASKVLDAVEPSFAQIYPTSRELVPSLKLTSEVRDAIVAMFANTGQMFNGRVRLAGGGIGGGVQGMPSVWNETIGGWLKKLPTSRGNPYPKPGAVLEIGKGKPLSYDCRHIHNTLWVPATGGRGAPPCITQGPWKFDGRSAYYPRLPLAAP